MLRPLLPVFDQDRTLMDSRVAMPGSRGMLPPFEDPPLWTRGFVQWCADALGHEELLAKN